MDRYEYIAAVNRACLVALVLSFPLGVLTWFYLGELPLWIWVVNVMVRSLTFLVPLWALAMWGSYQRNYINFLLVTFGLPVFFVNLMGPEIFFLESQIELVLLAPAILWPLMLVGYHLDYEELAPAVDVKAHLRLGIWVVIALWLATFFLIPFRYYPSNWVYLPWMLPYVILPLNLVFLYALYRRAPGPEPGGLRLFKEGLLFTALVAAAFTLRI